MSWRAPAWGSLRRGKSRLSREAGASLFQGLRIRLTLWYCGVLGAALVLFSVALYFGAQYFLLNPIQSDTQFHARGHQSEWSQGAVNQACPFYSPQNSFGPPFGQGQRIFTPEIAVCFDQNGALLSAKISSGCQLRL